MRAMPVFLLIATLVVVLPSPAPAAPETVLGLKSPGALRVLGGRVIGPPSFAGRGVTIGSRLIRPPGRPFISGYQSGRALLETSVLGFSGEALSPVGSRSPAVRAPVPDAVATRRALSYRGASIAPPMSDADRGAIAAGLRRIFDPGE